MQNDKSKNIIIVLLIIIIIILGGLVVLFATDTIKLNTSSNNVESGDMSIQENENDNTQKEESSIVGYYQEIVNYAPDAYTIFEFKLNNDNTVSYIIGGSNNKNHTDAAEIMNYSGTYLEKDNKIILSIISTDVNCEPGKYACEDIITLTKQDDKTLVGNDSLTETYDKVESLLLIK